MADGWTAYIRNLLDSSDCIKKAAIVGASDGGIWAKSDDFQGTPEELRKFVGAYDNLNELPGIGFHLEKVKYIVPRTDDNLIFGKQGKTGVFAIKTKMAVIIACYEGETDKGQECRTAVEKLGAYLASSGY